MMVLVSSDPQVCLVPVGKVPHPFGSFIFVFFLLDMINVKQAYNEGLCHSNLWIQL